MCWLRAVLNLLYACQVFLNGIMQAAPLEWSPAGAVGIAWLRRELNGMVTVALPQTVLAVCLRRYATGGKRWRLSRCVRAAQGQAHVSRINGSSVVGRLPPDISSTRMAVGSGLVLRDSEV